MVSRDCTSKYWNYKYVIHTTKLETPYSYSWCITNPICYSLSSASFSPPEEYIGYFLREAPLILTFTCLKLVQPLSCVNTLKHIHLHTYMTSWSTQSGTNQSFKFIKKRRWIANKSKANALVYISACWYSEGTCSILMGGQALAKSDDKRQYVFRIWVRHRVLRKLYGTLVVLKNRQKWHPLTR